MTRSTASAHAPAARQPDTRRLLYVRSTDFDRWQCRPLGWSDILDLDDRRVGHLDGMVIDRRDTRSIYLVIAARCGPGPQTWFLVPVGDASFDDIDRAVRIDMRGDEVLFDPGEFEQMTREEADEFERRALARCCSEVGFHGDGSPDYARLQRFTWPTWLRYTSFPTT